MSPARSARSTSASSSSSASATPAPTRSSPTAAPPARTRSCSRHGPREDHASERRDRGRGMGRSASPRQRVCRSSESARGERGRRRDPPRRPARQLHPAAALDRGEHADGGDPRRPRLRHGRLRDGGLPPRRGAGASSRDLDRLRAPPTRRARASDADARQHHRGTRELCIGGGEAEQCQPFGHKRSEGLSRGSLPHLPRALGERRADRLRGQALALREGLDRQCEAASPEALRSRRRPAAPRSHDVVRGRARGGVPVGLADGRAVRRRARGDSARGRAQRPRPRPVPLRRLVPRHARSRPAATRACARQSDRALARRGLRPHRARPLARGRARLAATRGLAILRALVTERHVGVVHRRRPRQGDARARDEGLVVREPGRGRRDDPVLRRCGRGLGLPDGLLPLVLDPGEAAAALARTVELCRLIKRG